MIRHILIAAICLHLGAGFAFGLMMKQRIPALNPLGMAYIAIHWQRQLGCVSAGNGCDPAPPEWLGPYLFSFPKH